MPYQHTQYAPLHYIIAIVAAILLAIAWLAQVPEVVAYLLYGIAAFSIFLAFSFRSLSVSDKVDRLQISFGPLPIFSKSIPYTQITGVEPGKSNFIDGWGIHYVPGRGWTYNLWGYDCAVLRLNKKTIRIGTDDVENLVDFLNQKIKTPL